MQDEIQNSKKGLRRLWFAFAEGVLAYVLAAMAFVYMKSVNKDHTAEVLLDAIGVTLLLLVGVGVLIYRGMKLQRMLGMQDAHNHSTEFEKKTQIVSVHYHHVLSVLVFECVYYSSALLLCCFGPLLLGFVDAQSTVGLMATYVIAPVIVFICIKAYSATRAYGQIRAIQNAISQHNEDVISELFNALNAQKGRR